MGTVFVLIDSLPVCRFPYTCPLSVNSKRSLICSASRRWLTAIGVEDKEAGREGSAAGLLVFTLLLRVFSARGQKMDLPRARPPFHLARYNRAH